MHLCLTGTSNSAKVLCIAKFYIPCYHDWVAGELAIIGVQAAGVGLDFSAAQSIAFDELPKSASVMLQVLASCCTP